VTSPIYAFTLDVAGEDEGATHDLDRLDNPRRDSTALTIFEVEIPTVETQDILAT
jgi:hypothetical protein